METTIKLKNTPDPKTIVARWEAHRRSYIVNCAHNRCWFSTDGDVWIDGYGAPVTDDYFRHATIYLHGGPRAGETVS